MSTYQLGRLYLAECFAGGVEKFEPIAGAANESTESLSGHPREHVPLARGHAVLACRVITDENVSRAVGVDVAGVVNEELSEQ